ncbi:MAG: hypothetical protein SGJ10_09015 [Bacteroidota bacterium]|nr:hypothetical protein [Bacteroidota bacterium]
MKIQSIFSAILLTFLSFKGFAGHTELKSAATHIKIYDSMTNFLQGDAYSYLGQTLFLKPLNDDLKQNGYDGFIKDYHIDSYIPENIYYNDENNHSNYDRLFGKRFIVIDVIKPMYDSANYGSGSDYAFQLINLSNNDTLYYIYQSEYEHTFHFIVEGYWHKQKSLAVGKKFIFSDTYVGTSVDLVKGTLIATKIGDVWTCEDIKMDDIYYTMAVILKNKEGQKIATDVLSTLGPNRKGKSYYKWEADKYTQKFGKPIFDNILMGRIAIGYTMEMCTLVMGKAIDIKSSWKLKIPIEEWKMENGQTLLFENGILKKII